MIRTGMLALFLGLAAGSKGEKGRDAATRSAASASHRDQVVEQLQAELPPDLLIGEVVMPAKLEVPKGFEVRATWRRAPKAGNAFALMEVVRNSTVQRRAFVRVEVLAIHDVLVAQRDLREGDVVGKGDLALEPRFGQKGLALDPAGLVGAPVLADLGRGEPVHAANVELPVPIARGSVVTVVVRVGAATIESQARLEATARPGERVRVRVKATRRVVTGLLRDEHTVEVDPEAQP